MDVFVRKDGVFDTSRETMDFPLQELQEVILGPFSVSSGQRIGGTIIADTIGTLYIEQSFDGENWDASTSTSVQNTNNGVVPGEGFVQTAIAPLVRARYVNGVTPQTTMRFYARTFARGR